MAKGLKNKAKIIIKFLKNKFYTDNLHKSLGFSRQNTNFLINRVIPIWQIASQVKGCVVECGVGYGRSALLLEVVMSLSNDKRPFYLLDSFQGFPELTQEDLTGELKSHKGAFNEITPNDLWEILSVSEGQSADHYIKKNINRVKIFKGFFEDKLNDDLLKSIEQNGGISLLHLDVDLYESYKVTLNYFWDLVNKGGVIMLDEYHSSSLKKYPGAKLAIDEFLKTKNINPDEVIKFDNSPTLKKCYLIKP